MKDLCITLWNESPVNEGDFMAYINNSIGLGRPGTKDWEENVEFRLHDLAEDFASRHSLGFWPESTPKGRPVFFFWGEPGRFPMPGSAAYFKSYAQSLND